MTANIKKNVYLGLIAFIIIGLVISISSFALPYMFFKDNETLTFIASIAKYFAGFFAVGCAAIPFLAKQLFKAYDEANYDEFGVNKKINRHMMNRKEREKMEAERMMAIDKVIPRETLNKMIKEGSTNPKADLNKLIGLADVKQKISEMEARMIYEASESKKNRRDISKEHNHMVFFGSPGTGKTTVARIITGLLYEYYYIDKNKVIECDGNFLKANSSSDTALKVKMLVRAAYGGVLFVDEAYALCNGHDEVGYVALATLIKEMEDNGDKFVLILAGYKDEMSMLLDMNTGFRSRIKTYIGFEDYNESELVCIFKSMLKEKGFTVATGALNNFAVRMQEEKLFPSWGNARTVRNVVEECIDRHSVRFINEKLPKSEKHIIDMEDILENKPYVGI